ncbi:MAG: ABC transporter substrate-binding protein, partial [Lachnospiraceae bacterium]|nr:ABC transporter substrate-binding protein [Lachnospiraceae bacterium]
MKKKVLSVVLAAAMVLSLAACDKGTEKGGETSTTTEVSASTNTEEETPYQLTTLKMVVDGTLTANADNRQDAFEEQWEKAVSEKMGYSVDLVIEQQDHSGYKDAVGRILLGGDLPDVMLMSADMYKQYQTTGLLWNMAEAYDNAEFQSRMDMPAINQNMKTADGALYGFAPYYGNGCVTYVKTSWLDAVGMKAEDIKTYDDYIAMLTAFATQDPDGNGVNGDTYGVIAAGFGKMDEAPYINYMSEFYQGAYPAILQDANGVWYDGFQTQEMKDALLRMQDAYNKGLIDPETLTASTKTAREKFFSNEQSGSSGAFTYWAGTWYQTLTDNLIKNEV